LRVASHGSCGTAGPTVQVPATTQTPSSYAQPSRLCYTFVVHYDCLALPLPERALISRIRRASRAPLRLSKGHSVVVGIGDDASVLRIPKDQQILVTTDFSLEGVHFRREWHPPESVGHRCLARGLSDIAAMGGEPIAAFLSLAVPPKLPQKWVDGFLKGLLALAKRFNVKLAGGDTAESPGGVLADIVVIGTVRRIPTRKGEKWGTPVLRSRARPGDRIYVTGELGGSAAALDALYSGRKSRLSPAEFRRHFFPEPRIAVGRTLREKQIATSMIDLSDGLSTDLGHICEESKCGAEIHEKLIPLARVAKPPHKVDEKFALHGGEDYELLFTASARTRVPPQIAGVPITKIGIITRGSKPTLVTTNGAIAFEPQGWEHFRTRA
jgi:thiamine-monophosphate kinase